MAVPSDDRLAEMHDKGGTNGFGRKEAQYYQMAKFDPFLSLDCARVGSNFAV